MRRFGILSGILILLGLSVVGQGLFAVPVFLHYPQVWLMVSLIALMDLFPMKLPYGMVFSASVIGHLFLLFEFGIMPVALSIMMGAIAEQIRQGATLRQTAAWKRSLLNMGMYYVASWAAYGVLLASGSAAVLWRAVLAIIVFEAVNAVLLSTVYWAANRPSPIPIKVSFLREVAVPILICAVVLEHLLNSDSQNRLASDIIYSGTLVGILIFLTNQYSRIVQARQESEHKYRLIAENTSDIIIILGSDGIIQYASPSNAYILGLPSETMLGKHFSEFVHPHDIETLQVGLQRLFEIGEQGETEFRVPQPDRDLVVLEARSTPVLSQNRKVERVVIVARDITDRKASEELLRKSDKLAIVGELAAGIAHEIRNPLTALKGFLQLIQSELAGVPGYFSIMWSELNRIEWIVNEFLFLAKPRSSAEATANLRQILDDVTFLLEGEANLNNVTFSVISPLVLPPVNCDENQIKQVFINVLKNAIEAMPSGGLVSVDAEPIEFNRVRVRCVDQGQGIPKDRIARLGEPFYTTKEKGTGLGLMVSYKIVQDHNGSMSIRSDVGKGTTVEITLPTSPVVYSE